MRPARKPFPAAAARTKEPAQALCRIQAPEFNLQTTLASGQVFHWIPCKNGYAGCIGQQACYVEQKNGQLLASQGIAQAVRHYFALDEDLQTISAAWPSDAAMEAARRFAWGMRILRQPLWECLATFITSSLKQVPHIAQISHTLRRTYGQPLAAPWSPAPIYSYPAPERLAACTEADLRACGLGFRAKYILGSAKAVAEARIDLEALTSLPTKDIRSALCSLPGVGEKIANCVLLFAYHRLEAFPVDVWIERVLRAIYFPRRKPTPAKLRDFAASYFGAFGGYAQQYLFHHARMTRGASLAAPSGPLRKPRQKVVAQNSVRSTLHIYR